MNGFVLNMNGDVLNMTGFVLNMNGFVKFNSESSAQICSALFNILSEILAYQTLETV